MIGQTLGHYRVLDKLGEGGMGIYLVVDTTLDRQVALKLLPAELAESQERLERSEREAKTLAALDHPNIVHIYSVGSVGLAVEALPDDDDVGAGLAPAWEGARPSLQLAVRRVGKAALARIHLKTEMFL